MRELRPCWLWVRDCSNKTEYQYDRPSRAGFLCFLKDFELIPKLLTTRHASDCFKSARSSPRGGRECGADSLNVEEFVDAVGRCALVAFHYAESVQADDVAFAENYSSYAKNLWVPKKVRGN
jgi:hypothetical protein